MSPTQCMGHIYTKKLFTVYLKFKFNFLYFHLLNLRNLDMWLMDSGHWLTGCGLEFSIHFTSSRLLTSASHSYLELCSVQSTHFHHSRG